MAGLAGISLGPTMDWMQDNAIYNHFLICKAQVEHLLKGPLHELAKEQQVHYLCIWSGTEGNKLIERFKAEVSIISTGADQMPTNYIPIGTVSNLL